MKVIFIARKALAAYLISSLVRRPVKTIGVSFSDSGTIELAHHRLGALVLGADDHAVGTLEVLDGGAFAQELGVGDHGELGVGAAALDDRLDLVAGADRHGRLGDDDGEAVDQAGDLLGRGVDIGQVGVAVAATGRGAHGDEHRVGVLDRLSARAG
jgi:hypothetical protein